MYELKFVWRHSAPIIPSLIARRQPIATSVQKFPDLLAKSVTRVDVSGEVIRLLVRLRLAVDFSHAMYIENKQMLVIHFIFDLL
jgi:hypothetical protein